MDAFREQADREPIALRTRIRRAVVPMLGALVVVTLISVVHPPRTYYGLCLATLIPVGGAIDLAHQEHCKSEATGKPLDGEVAILNRIVRRLGPVLMPIGAVVALAGIVGVVFASIC